MKRVLSFILVLSMVLGSFGMAFADSAASDIAGHENEEAILRLNKLGIVEGDDRGFAPDDNITRAEYAVMVIRALGLESSAEMSKGDTPFTDVTMTNGYGWATGAINVATKLGYIEGYGDGKYGPADNIRYEDAVTLIVRVLGYEPAAQDKGGYPVGYLVVAEQDLDITDNVTAVAGLAATRGAVFQMLDNALTEPMMIQVGYGTDKKYVVSGQKGTDTGKQTILTDKLGIEEVEGRVTSNFRVGSKIRANEIEITDEDGKTGKYKVSDEFDVDALLGLEITAWEDKDDILFRYEIETDEEDILYDAVDSANEDEVELVVEDDEFDWAEDGATVYVNNEPVTRARDYEEKISKNAYGRFVLDEYGEVVFAYLFDFEDSNIGVVIEVEKDVIEFVNADRNEEDLELDDFDDVYVFNADFSKADVEDIDEDSAIFFWEDDDDVFIIVKNDFVEGEVDRVRSDKIRIDDKEYKKGDYAFITLDEGDSYKEWSLEDVEDFIDEEVKVIFDLCNKILFVKGDAEVKSEWMYGIVTYASDGRNVVLTIFNEEGKEVEYKADRGLKMEDFDVDLEFDKESYAVIKFKLNSDGEIEAEEDYIIVPNESEEYPEGVYAENFSKSSDSKRFELDDVGSFYITKDTVVMKAIKKDKLDPEVLSTENLIDNSVDGEDSDRAIVFVGKGKDADFIVFTDSGFEAISEELLYGVVTDGPWKEGSYYAEINVFGEGTDEYKVSDREEFANGSVVGFRINNKDEAVVYEEFITGVPGAYSNGYLAVEVEEEEEEYKVDSSAVLYSLKSNGNVDKKVSVSRLKDYETIKFVLDEDEILVAAVVSKEAATPPSKPIESDGKLAYDFTVGDEIVRINVDGKIKSYIVGETSLILDKNDVEIDADEIIEAGEKVNFVLIEGTDEVDILKFVEVEVSGV